MDVSGSSPRVPAQPNYFSWAGYRGHGKWKCPTSVKLFHYIDDVLLTSNSLADLKQCAPGLVKLLESCG